MKPKIKKMNKFIKFIVFNNVIAITLAPFAIYIRDDKIMNNEKTINHEKIHWKQQVEMLILPFYIWYLIEFIIRLFINGNSAYKKLLFEQEAYNNDKNYNYLNNRKMYSWLKYF